MPKIFTPEEKLQVIELSKQGKTHKEIAEIMKRNHPDHWSAKNSFRSVSKILRESEEDLEQEVVALDADEAKTLDEMSRDERYRFIQSRLRTTPRFNMAFKQFDDEERDFFVDEYLNIIRSTDTLTEAEEQSLFAAILSLTLSFQALNRKEKLEKLRDRTLNGEFEDDDPRFTRIVDDKYQREHDQHMKSYVKAMEGLKMSRQQRLKEVRSQKLSLVDIAESLSSKNVQAEIAEEIEALSKLKDAELKRLIELGHVYAKFEGYE